MKKIPTLFVRDEADPRRVTREVSPGCEWVLAGEGHATRKLDGTCVLVRNGQLFKRYDAKGDRTPPLGFEPCEDSTGRHVPGWVPCDRGNPADRYHWEAFDAKPIVDLRDGTYELIGPKINANPEKFATHVLIRHGLILLDDRPRTYDDLAAYLATQDVEGIVWHHPDGRMAKIKLRDFGLTRGAK